MSPTPGPRRRLGLMDVGPSAPAMPRRVGPFSDRREGFAAMLESRTERIILRQRAGEALSDGCAQSAVFFRLADVADRFEDRCAARVHPPFSQRHCYTFTSSHGLNDIG